MKRTVRSVGREFALENICASVNNKLLPRVHFAPVHVPDEAISCVCVCVWVCVCGEKEEEGEPLTFCVDSRNKLAVCRNADAAHGRLWLWDLCASVNVRSCERIVGCNACQFTHKVLGALVCAEVPADDSSFLVPRDELSCVRGAICG